MWLKLSTGRINKQTTINVTNSGAGTESVQAVSTNISGIARRAVEQSINASANATFDTFEALFYDPTNVLRVNIVFANGYVDEYTDKEILKKALAKHNAEPFSQPVEKHGLVFALGLLFGFVLGVLMCLTDVHGAY